MSVRVAGLADFQPDATGVLFFAFRGRLLDLEVAGDPALGNTVQVNDGRPYPLPAGATRIWDTWPEDEFCEYIIRIGGVNVPARVWLSFQVKSHG